MRAHKPSYTPAPQVPAELMPRLAAIVEVLAGLKTVSEAARSLELSRNHFQTLLHRAVLGLVQAITPKAGGRPATAPQMASLQTQLQRLKRENTRLHKRVDSTDRLLEVASGLLHGRIRPTGRQRRARKSPAHSGDRHDDSDPEAQRRRVLEAVQEMRRLGLTATVAANIAGVDASTLRRWRARRAQSPTRQCRARGEPLPLEAAATRGEAFVRRLHGLIGAEALRHCIDGLSRRAAAAVKAQTLTAMERERKASLVRVTIMQPGVLRGLDAMQVSCLEGHCFALIAADGAVPYRTSVTVGPCYDSALVAHALRIDLERHGAPLVLRLDRASVHTTALVREVLEANRVVILHGPPRYPCFYGQLERQNREHRAWIAALPPMFYNLLEPCLREMLESVNTLWPRCTLHWRTAAQVWNARVPLIIDREAFREEVHERETRIARRMISRGSPADLAERLAIEQTLASKGYLRQQIGGWC
jgi:transposase InsO family protein